MNLIYIISRYFNVILVNISDDMKQFDSIIFIFV